MLRAAAASGASAAGVAAAAQSREPDRSPPTSNEPPAESAGAESTGAEPTDREEKFPTRRDRRAADSRSSSRSSESRLGRRFSHLGSRSAAAGAPAAAAAGAGAGAAGAPAAAAAGAGTGTAASAATETRSSDDLGDAGSTPAGPSRARRHSSRLGEAFPSLVGWTSLSTLLPGIGLLRTRFRRLGIVLLAGFALIVLGGLLYLLIKGPVRAIGMIVANPSLLNVLAIVVAIAGAVWIIVMVISHLGLRKGHRYTPWQNKLAGVLVVSLALIIGIPFGVGSVYARVQSSTVSSLFGDSTGKAVGADELWADKPYINVFLMGRDNGDDREGTRPDTMLVASIDTKTGNAALISVPRNLAFPIFPEGSSLAEAWPDGFRPTGDSSVDLINSVWQWGEQNKDAVGDTNGLEPGMVATMQAVQGSLGLNLDYWASVDMAGFQDVVDAIGGVKIDVERPIPMGGGKSMSGVPNKIYGWVDPGEQTLKGKDALWYVRSREGSDNYDRMCRQQRMLKTTLEQIDPQELAAAYPKLASSATKNIATSIPQNEIPAFIELAVAMQKGDVTTVQINNDVTPTYNPDFDVLHKWILDEVKGASDGQETPQPTNDGSEATDKSEDESTDSTKTDETTEAEQPADEDSDEQGSGAESEDESEAENPGEPNAEGKCYPKDYTPGDPFPGYPGPGAGDEG